MVDLLMSMGGDTAEFRTHSRNCFVQIIMDSGKLSE